MKDLILLSGGLDSAVCLYLSENPTLCLGYDYGQSHVIELQFAERLAENRGVPFIEEELHHLNKSDDVVFHGRNFLMIASAIPFAHQHGCNRIVIGSNQSDWSRFPDCRPDFFKGVRQSLEAYNLNLSTPLLHSMKSDVVRHAKFHGVPINETWSCYNPNGDEPCGKCLACETRAKALA